jgi:hypothetical protein
MALPRGCSNCTFTRSPSVLIRRRLRFEAKLCFSSPDSGKLGGGFLLQQCHLRRPFISYGHDSPDLKSCVLAFLCPRCCARTEPTPFPINRSIRITRDTGRRLASLGDKPAGFGRSRVTRLDGNVSSALPRPRRVLNR